MLSSSLDKASVFAKAKPDRFKKDEEALLVSFT